MSLLQYILAFGYRLCKEKGNIEYSHHQLGWYKKQDKYHYLYDTNIINRDISHTNRKSFEFQSGSESDYKKFLHKVIFPIPTLSLAMAIGYSAVVQSKLQLLNNFETTIVNLCGVSSTGKTTVEQLMVSPFARPVISNNGGLIRNFHSTANARFAGLEGINGLPMVLDDATTADYLNISEMIYTIASSCEKGRCNQNGTMKEGLMGWSGTVIISSETPLLDCTKQNLGLKARVIQTDGITWTPDAETADYIKEFVGRNYGFTGKEFAEFVNSCPDSCLNKQYNYYKKYVENLMIQKDSLTHRLSNKYASIALTIKIMNIFFGISLDVKMLMEILLKPEQDNVLERDISKKALEKVVNFVIEKKNHFQWEWLTNTGLAGEHPVSAKGDCLGSIVVKNAKTWYVYIPTAITDKILEDNKINEKKNVRKLWVDKGITKGDNDHNSVKKTINASFRRCDCFIFPEGITFDYQDEIDKIRNNSNTSTTEPLCPAPLTTYIYTDDESAIDKIFEEKNNEKE